MRARNRALVAAKTQQLPDILRNWKTAEITAHAVKIEQTILDLNHECEVAKDKAQHSVADSTNQETNSNLQRSRPDTLMAVRGRGALPAAAGQGFLGITMAAATNDVGVLVESVLPGSPAGQSGLTRSDTIVAAQC